MLATSTSKQNTPSVIALTRQGINPIRLNNSLNNKSSMGAYEILRTRENSLTIIGSAQKLV